LSCHGVKPGDNQKNEKQVAHKKMKKFPSKKKSNKWDWEGGQAQNRQSWLGFNFHWLTLAVW
jgi:hypothetical protein